MRKRKMCELCGKKPATVPDRERMGRLINRVCSDCHAGRLRGDLHQILASRQLHDLHNDRTGFDGK
jgi:hypothetical protein